MNKRVIAVIGLGRFGTTVAKAVADLGHEVLAVDVDPDRVQKISPYVTHAVIADSTDEAALQSLSLNQFDAVVVAIGANKQANLMTAMLVEEQGVRRVIAKAQDELQGRLLEKIDVDTVIYPESDMAMRLAQMLTRRHVVDYLQLSAQAGLVEMETPEFLVGKTLKTSGLREKYRLIVAAIRHDENLIVAPDPDIPLAAEDKLIIIGRDDDIHRLENT